MAKNRARTEARILQAARSLLAHGGFADFGINAVSQHAAADKVLIYRYFGGLDGLLTAVAEEEEFLPEEEDFIRQHGTSPYDWLEGLPKELEARPLTRQLLRWSAVYAETKNDNPLLRACRLAWEAFINGLFAARGTVQDNDFEHLERLALWGTVLAGSGVPSSETAAPIIKSRQPAPARKPQPPEKAVVVEDDDELPVELL